MAKTPFKRVILLTDAYDGDAARLAVEQGATLVTLPHVAWLNRPAVLITSTPMSMFSQLCLNTGIIAIVPPTWLQQSSAVGYPLPIEDFQSISDTLAPKEPVAASSEAIQTTTSSIQASTKEHITASDSLTGAALLASPHQPVAPIEILDNAQAEAATSPPKSATPAEDPTTVQPKATVLQPEPVASPMSRVAGSTPPSTEPATAQLKATASQQTPSASSKSRLASSKPTFTKPTRAQLKVKASQQKHKASSKSGVTSSKPISTTPIAQPKLTQAKLSVGGTGGLLLQRESNDLKDLRKRT